MRVLAIIQAGGQGSRMDVLTRERAKPTLPVAGVYQLLDFPLSNLTHSGVTDVWLSVQYHGASLEEQVANGRPWDLDRTRGGLRLLMPEEGTGGSDEDGFARGNADELYRIRDQVRMADPEVVVVLSADHVYRLDVADLVRHHLEHDLECTVVTTEVDLADAPDHAVVTVREGRVTDVDYKPEDPDGTTVAAEIIAYRPTVLVEVLEELHRDLAAEAGPGDTGLGDFGDHLLPRMVERGRTGAFELPGYWRDLGQPRHYLRAHRELLLDDLGVLNDPAWPILTRHTQRGPARLLDGAEVVDSLVSSGCVVAGRVERSVLGPGRGGRQDQRRGGLCRHHRGGRRRRGPGHRRQALRDRGAGARRVRRGRPRRQRRDRAGRPGQRGRTRGDAAGRGAPGTGKSRTDRPLGDLA
jgi:glucose-1-phosphate adenylyltransferase